MHKLTINRAGIDLIKDFEKFKPKMYLDAAGLPTIGYGTLIDTLEEKYLLTATITEPQALELLHKDVTFAVKECNKLITSNVNQNQFSALVSFVYNAGTNNLRRSTLLKLVNQNPNNKKTLPVEVQKDKSVVRYLTEKGITHVNIITYWMLVYNRSGGRTLNGLLRRRWEESLLYWKQPNQPV